MSDNYVSVGIEIETNRSTGHLNETAHIAGWAIDQEHCGIEYRTGKPAVGFSGLKNLKRCLRQYNKATIDGGDPGFNNTGTHIHIDFATEKSGALKATRKICKMVDGLYPDNPVDVSRRTYFVDENGNTYRYNPNAKRGPRNLYINTPKEVLGSVKKFMILGSRFADVFFALQHPDRRFNKYCHTLKYWNEAVVCRQQSVRDIGIASELQHNHKRYMFNVLPFSRLGTVEVRMIKGSTNAEELWAYIVLFVRLANYAKSDNPLPIPTGNIAIDFSTILNALKITGKARKTLADLMNRSLKTKGFNCFCYYCYEHYDNGSMIDFGLSRSVCELCNEGAFVCCNLCGAGLNNQSRYKMDPNIEFGRFICKSCKGSEHLEQVLEIEKTGGYKTILTQPIYNEFDNWGLRNMRDVRTLYS